MRKHEETMSPSKSKRDQSEQSSTNQMEDLRDRRFFLSKVDDESLGDTHGKSLQNELSDQKQQYSEEKTAAPPSDFKSKESTTYDAVILPTETQVAQQQDPNVFPNSPLSDQNFEFFKGIEKGGHSLSSTDSDMAKAISAANGTTGEGLDSPPDLISPKNKQSMGPLISVNDMQDENMQMADHMADFILTTLLR